MRRRGIKLLIIDNLITISGTLDENKPEIAGVMSHIRRLSDNLKIATILLHHPPKADDEVLRGHGSILSALDLSLHVRREGLGDTITVKPKKARQAVPEAFSAQFEYTHKAGTQELETARFWGIDTQENTRLTPSQRDVLSFYAKAGPSTIAVAKGGVRKTNPNTVVRASWELVRMGFLSRVDHGGNGSQAVLEPVRNRLAQVFPDLNSNKDTCVKDSRTGVDGEND